MLKGFIVIFTAIISYLVFKRKFTKLQIVGIGAVVLGLVLVGLCNIHSYNAKFAPHPLLGNSLVILAQLFLAGMFVYEEKILKEYDVHVFEIVGWEGFWGMLLSAFFIAIFYFIPGRDMGSWENPFQATHQILYSSELLIAMLCSSLVIGPFNYFGTNLTKYSSAMHRCLIDASRMCVVWLISIFCGWEHFKLQQSAGYLFVLLGNLIYYEIIKFPESTDKNLSALPDEERISTCKDDSDKLKVVKSKNANENSSSKGTFSYLFGRFGNKKENNNEITVTEEKDLLKDGK